MNFQQISLLEKINEYESSLSPKIKSDYGIFYTEISLAEMMLSELQIQKDKVVLDPTCGTGSFIIAANRLGLNNVYGMDIDQKAVEVCKSIVPTAKVLNGNSIGNTPYETLNQIGLSQDEKVDYIVGNPPYAQIYGDVLLNTTDLIFYNKVTNSGNNLFVATMMRSLDLLRNGGILSFIIPKNFLFVSSYSLFRRYLLKEKTIVSIIDIGSYFKQVRGEQIIITIKNIKPEDNLISIKKLEGNKFILLTQFPQKLFNNEIILFSNLRDYELYISLLYNNHLSLLNELGKIKRGKSRSSKAIKGKDIRKFGFKNQMLPSKGNRIFIQNIYSSESGIIASFGGNLEASQTVTIYETIDEVDCRYILGILHSKLYNYILTKFIFNNSKLTMHTDADYIGKIPIPEPDRRLKEKILFNVSKLENVKYLSLKWLENLNDLSELVFDLYRVSKEDREYINIEMSKVQSIKWQNDGLFKKV